MECEVVLCDVTGRNPNVNYELGIAHALQKPAIIITKDINDVPFDYRHLRVVTYDQTKVDWAQELNTNISNTIEALRSDPKNALAWIPKGVNIPQISTSKPDGENRDELCTADWRIAERRSLKEGSDKFSSDSSDLYFLMLSVLDCNKSRILIRDLRASIFPQITIEAMYDLMGSWDLLVKFRSDIDPLEFENKAVQKLISKNMMEESKDSIFGRRKLINVVAQSRNIAGLLKPRNNETIYHTLLSESEEYENYRASRAFLFLEALGDPQDEQRKAYIQDLTNAINGKLGSDIIESVCEGESEIIIETFSSCSQSNHINHLNKSVEPVLTAHGLQKYTLSCYFYDETGLLYRAPEKTEANK
ncbi:MAG: hypothetical protein ABW134_19735 [Candidatus Thiodiazotropha endolucinida]